MGRNGWTRALSESTEAADAQKKPKGVWNSLEVFKLVASGATPLAIFVLGYTVSTSSQRAAFEREDRVIAAAQFREAEATKAARAREESIRLEGHRRDDEIRERARRDALQASIAAFEREKALRAEAAARDAASRRESNAREEAIRSQAQDETRRSRLFELRLRAWEVGSPKLADARSRFSLIGESTLDALVARERVEIDLAQVRLARERAEEGASAIRAYQSVFSERFIEYLQAYEIAFRNYARRLEGCAVGTCDHESVLLAGGNEGESYYPLVNFARREMEEYLR
jgi:hypothetical protein